MSKLLVGLVITDFGDGLERVLVARAAKAAFASAAECDASTVGY